MTDLREKLDELSTEQVIEACTTVLLENCNVTSFDEALDLVAAATGDQAAIAAEARSAAAQSADQVARLMAAALEGMAEQSDPAQQDMIEEAVHSAGEKQIMVDGNLIAIGILLLCAYAVKVTRGEAKVTTTFEYEDAPDGRRVAKVHKTVEKINPFGPLGQLLDRIFGRRPSQPAEEVPVAE